MAGRNIGSEPSSSDEGSNNEGKPSVYDQLRESLREQNELPEKIFADEIQPHDLGVGGTEIVLQRHGKYITEVSDPRVGSLTLESENDQEDKARSFVEGLLSEIPEDEWDTLDILIIASDTQYMGGGRRSLETATAVQKGMQEALEDAGLGEDRIINNTTPVRTLGGQLAKGQPRIEPRLREPQAFDKSPEYIDMLEEKHGKKTQAFWIAFEGDHHAEERVAMGAEGPDDIADRTISAVDTLARYAEAYHKSHPGRRLVIWAATHYDTISPLVKREIAGKEKDDTFLVDYGAGITIDIPQEGKAKSTIAGKQYEVPLKTRS